MRFLSIIALLFVLIPHVSVAEEPSPTAAPAITDTAPSTPTIRARGPLVLNFPAEAITRVGENTSGEYNDAPPVAQDAPAAPAAPTATTPENPTMPASPPSPISKLWPRDTVQIFLPPCTNYHPELVVLCTCVITKLMTQMPHDEFLKLSEAGTIEQDVRLTTIRQECVTAPRRRE